MDGKIFTQHKLEALHEIQILKYHDKFMYETQIFHSQKFLLSNVYLQKRLKSVVVFQLNRVICVVRSRGTSNVRIGCERI
jgi:hypothetical protein